MAQAKEIAPKLKQYEVGTAIIKVGAYFGLIGEQRFYHLRSITNPDGSCVVDRYAIREGVAHMDVQASTGYILSSFAYSSMSGRLWVGKPPVPVHKAEPPKQEEKYEVEQKASKPIIPSVSSEQGSLF